MATSKLTVAQLIGETPEMLRACGRILQIQHDRQSMTRTVYRAAKHRARADLTILQEQESRCVAPRHCCLSFPCILCDDGR